MNYKKFQDTSTNPERSREGPQRASASYGTNKTLVAQIILVAIIAGGILLFERLFDRNPSLINEGSAREATLLIDFNNMTRMFQGEVIEGMTVLDVLNAAVAAGKIKLVYFVDENNNTRIVEINDHVADGDNQFFFYINSRKIDSSELNRIYVQPEAKVTVKIE